MNNSIGNFNVSLPTRSSPWLILLAAFAVSQAGCSAELAEDEYEYEEEGEAADDDFEYSEIVGGLAAPGAWNPPPHVRNAGAGQFVPYHDAPPWKSDGSSCGGKLLAGTKQLGDFLKANFPGRVSSYGGYACRQNTANKAKTSVHGTGRALDVFIPLDAGKADNGKGDEVANWLILNAQAIGVQYIIWDRTDWGGNRKGDKVGAYGGPHPHHDHIHLELTHEGAAKKTPWFTKGSEPIDPISVDNVGPRSVASNADGRMEVFFRGGDKALWHRWQIEPDGAWSGEEKLGGYLASEPVMGRNKSGRLEVFFRGGDKALWNRWQLALNDKWSNENKIGGALSSAPAVGSNADGRMEVFYRGTDNALWHRWQIEPDGPWSGEEKLGGVLSSLPVVAAHKDGTLNVFYRGTDNALYRRVQTAPNSGWSGEQRIGGALSAAPAVAVNEDGRLGLLPRHGQRPVAPLGGNSAWRMVLGGQARRCAGLGPDGRLKPRRRYQSLVPRHG